MAAYVTLSEAETYFSTEKLNTRAWDLTSSTDKTKALKQATNMINRLSYKGEKTVAAQDNEFPRNGDTTVIDDITIATNEIASSLVDGRDAELEYSNEKLVSQGFANVRSTYDQSKDTLWSIAGIPSMVAWHHLKPHLRDNMTFDISRVT